MDTALALAAVGPYGVYFGAYETLELMDAAHDELGFAYEVIAFETGLNTAYASLQTLEVMGLATDITIDVLHGETIDDEGHPGSIIPDPTQVLLGNPDPQNNPTCPCVDLPGLHDGQVDIHTDVPPVGLSPGDLFAFFLDRL